MKKLVLAIALIATVGGTAFAVVNANSDNPATKPAVEKSMADEDDKKKKKKKKCSKTCSKSCSKSCTKKEGTEGGK